MFKQTDPEVKNRGICPKCDKVTPAHHIEREGKVYFVKECPDCGVTETLLSSDAERYRQKREMLSYQCEAEETCSLKCYNCNIHRTPTLVFIDVTNRCNMNCPICLANIPAMGFRFDPPLEYFDKIFHRLSELEPKPKLELFGGEPTVRNDLIEIIMLAKEKYGLSARVVTNGLRLADEEYCQNLLATGTELMFSFDGHDPEIYKLTRKHPEAVKQKLQALANIAKHRKSKITIMTCVGEGINDHAMAEMIDFCHEGRDYIAALDLIPLTANWGPEQVAVESSTIEDIERIMNQAAPGTEYFPAGMLQHLKTLAANFDVGRLTFGGAHPNCEVVAAFVSDGEKYSPISRFLKRSLRETICDFVKLDEEYGRKLERSLLAKLFGRKGRQLVYGKALLAFIKQNLDMQEVFEDNASKKIRKIIWGLIRGEKMKNLLRKHTRFHGILRSIILPFEEKDCVEAARLVICPAAFAYEHPLTKEIRFMPVCAWPTYKNDILRKTAESYGVDQTDGHEDQDALSQVASGS